MLERPRLIDIGVLAVVGGAPPPPDGRVAEEEGVTVAEARRRSAPLPEKVSSLQDKKEAKKIRWILTNRESARETIRRRQAIHDETTKRVSDLSSDNDKLEMEKELAMQEYKSLEETNQQLKEQIAKTVRPEVQGVTSSSDSQQTEDEMEATKICRILVNRESARESIRRRQAIYDELTKRISDLSSYNDKLKMEKELAMQEYMSLEQINKQMKEQIVKTASPGVQGVASSSACQQTEGQKKAKRPRWTLPNVEFPEQAIPLPQDEKKVKKHRRILANKIATRKSFLNRQAMHGELITKVAELSKDNENLKKEKDLATEEFMYMKNINMRLKEQV